MEDTLISPKNSIYILNTNYRSSDMMNFFTTPNTMWETGSGNVKNMSTVTPSPVQIKIPQRGTIGLADVENNNKETLNDKTRKSLLKINLFIKRQWFSIFSDSKRSEDGSSATGKDDISTAAISTFVTKPDARRLDETNQRKCIRMSSTRKYISTKEMYREAARSLGINCSLSSSCRCYECQSHYFDCYVDSTDQTEDLTDSDDDDDDDDDDDEDDSECESNSSEVNDADHYITNCYLIHTEELCECCQMHNEHKRLSSLMSTSIQQSQHLQSATQQAPPPPLSLTDLAASTINNNDLNFNTTFFS